MVLGTVCVTGEILEYSMHPPTLIQAKGCFYRLFLHIPKDRALFIRLPNFKDQFYINFKLQGIEEKYFD